MQKEEGRTLNDVKAGRDKERDRRDQGSKSTDAYIYYSFKVEAPADSLLCMVASSWAFE